MMKQLLLMDEEYCREIHVVAFSQKNCFIPLYQMMNDALFAKYLQIFSTYLPINNIIGKIDFISTSHVY